MGQNDFFLLSMLSNHDPDIVTISESNFDISDPANIARREMFFQGYHIIDKIFTNTTNARLTVLVKSEHTFECLTLFKIF